MKKNITLIILLICSLRGFSQDTLSYWDFNGSNATPTVGTGTFLHIGGTNNAYFTGSTNDPASTDKGYSTNNYPTQSTNPRTAGVQANVSTMGFENINLRFDIRFSSTPADTWVLQYTTDALASSPIWVAVDTFIYSSSSTWFTETFDFSSISALNNNANVAFRLVSDFSGTSSGYSAVSSSSYSTGGTARFDLVTITGDQVTPYEVAFEENSMTFSENSGTVYVVAEIKTIGNSSGSIDLQVSTLSNASNINDYNLMTSTAYIPTSKTIGDTVLFAFTLIDDAVIESDEYIICRFANGSNVIFDNDEQHTLFIRDNDGSIPIASKKLKLKLVTSFNNGDNSNNSAEIVAYDSASQRLFIANSIGSRLDIISVTDPSNPAWVDSIDVSSYGNINSVAVKNGIVACAMENGINPQANGSVAFFDTNGSYTNAVTVGAMPDMCAFNHAGTKIYVANEGEPNDAYTVDPDGSISVIDISGGIPSLTNSNVTTIAFTSLNGYENTLRNLGVRIYGPSANTAQDLEPEFITISDDDTKAWVSLQENNAIVELNLVSNTINSFYGLGYKNHNLMQNSLDASNKTDSVNFSTFPVYGMYQPDAIAQYSDGSNIYVLTANEGDSRDYGGFSEEERVEDLILDSTLYPQAQELQNEDVLGRLKTTSALGDIDNDGDHDSIFSYGTRSFSVWNASSGFSQTFDSEDQIERITAGDSTFGNIFNASNGSTPEFKDRSDDKGPEPEGIIVEKINGTPYAFVGLERIGGVMVYDLTNPSAPQYITYENNRTQDQGTEGMVFIPYTQSADSNNYLVLANETSSTITIYRVEEDCNSFQLTNATMGNDTTLPGSATNIQDQDANGNVNYYNATCGLIANVSNNTTSLGPTTISVFTDTNISVHNAQPYVARWYQITPTNNAAADVKLYFTQDDFDNYNAYATTNSWPLLPTSPADIAGIANLRITKTDNAGFGNNPLVITPTSNWNAAENVWELTFNTPSFSQFHVHAANTNNTPLPVGEFTLDGQVVGGTNQLSWKTIEEKNTSHFSIQHSIDGTQFINVSKLDSKSVSNSNNTEVHIYNFNHYNPTVGDNYYRIQQVDIDGTKNYSNVINLVQDKNEIVKVYPSPVSNILNISVKTAKTEKITISLFDLSGRLLKSQVNTINKNDSSIQLNVSDLAKGIYNLNIRSLDKVLTSQKIVKQ